MLTLSPDRPHRYNLLIQLFGIVTGPLRILWTVLTKTKGDLLKCAQFGSTSEIKAKSPTV